MFLAMEGFYLEMEGVLPSNGGVLPYICITCTSMCEINY